MQLVVVGPEAAKGARLADPQGRPKLRLSLPVGMPPFSFSTRAAHEHMGNRSSQNHNTPPGSLAGSETHALGSMAAVNVFKEKNSPNIIF